MNVRFLRAVCRGLMCLAIQILVSAPVMAQVERVSVATDGTQANGLSGNPSISANARFVVFTSTATNPDPFGYDSFVLIANRSEASGQVRVTFLRQLEEPIVQTYSLLPTSRFSIWLQDVLPNTVGNLGVLVEALDPLDLVVERSNYSDHNDGLTEVHWGLGDNALGAPLP